MRIFRNYILGFAVFAMTLFSSCSGKFTPFTFVHCTDTQIGFIDQTEGYAHSDSLLKAAFTAVNALKPMAVFVTGDLVDNIADPLQNAVFERDMALLSRDSVHTLQEFP